MRPGRASNGHLDLYQVHSAATLERALAVELDGTDPFRCVRATWNLLERLVGPALGAAHGAGWGVVVNEAEANGRLTPRGDVAGPPRAVAERHSTKTDAVALAAVLAALDPLTEDPRGVLGPPHRPRLDLSSQ